MKLQEFNFTINHCSSKDNIVADSLSRNIKINNKAKYIEDNTFNLALYKFSPDQPLVKMLKKLIQFAVRR